MNDFSQTINPAVLALQTPAGYCNLLWEFVPELQHSYEEGCIHWIKYFSWLRLYPEGKSNKTLTLGDTPEKVSPLKQIPWGEIKQQQKEAMFCLYSETRFLGEQSWNAIYKELVKGSEHPQRMNATSEKWYSLEPGEEVRRDKSRTWTWKSMTACVCWCVCVSVGDRKTESGQQNSMWLFQSKSESEFKKCPGYC